MESDPASLFVKYILMYQDFSLVEEDDGSDIANHGGKAASYTAAEAYACHSSWLLPMQASLMA